MSLNLFCFFQKFGWYFEFRIYFIFSIVSLSYNISRNNLVFISMSVFLWNIYKTWVMVLWNRLYSMSSAFLFYPQKQCLLWIKRIIFPMASLLKQLSILSKCSGANVFYNFNHLCSRICAHLKISKNPPPPKNPKHFQHSL